MSGTDLQTLLVKTSRTFALSIPTLDSPMREEVTVAYLLFRIADTFEDAFQWPRQERLAALDEFAGLLDEGSLTVVEETVTRWLASKPPIDHDGYLDLLRETPQVVAAYRALGVPSRSSVGGHTRRTCEGMTEFVRRADERGNLQLSDMADLKRYCYFVAGIVGEMLTDLFLLHESPLADVSLALRERATTFGEALQLVNILKDAADDAEEGRCFLPRQIELGEVFSRARDDLVVAEQYVNLLQKHGASRGAVSFTALPVLLARATLDKVELDGAGAKVDRSEVQRIVTALNQRLDNTEPAVGL